MKRGEIYYIFNKNTTGDEIAKSRPAVIVSDDHLNNASEVVEVVFLTTRPKRDLPAHAVIEATGVEAVVLCEQINTVSKSRVGHYCGECSAEEMEAIDRALLCSLGIEVAEGELVDEVGTEENTDLAIMYAKACAERDTYKKILDRIFDKWGLGDD